MIRRGKTRSRGGRHVGWWAAAKETSKVVVAASTVAAGVGGGGGGGGAGTGRSRPGVGGVPVRCAPSACGCAARTASGVGRRGRPRPAGERAADGRSLGTVPGGGRRRRRGDRSPRGRGRRDGSQRQAGEHRRPGT